MKAKSFVLFLIILTITSVCLSQGRKKEENLIGELLKSRPDLFKTILDDPAKFEIQILYTQIDRDKNNVPKFTSYKYRVNPKEYFYPASSVKLSAAILSLQKLNELKINNLNRNTPLRIDSVEAWQRMTDKDVTAPDSLPTIAQFIRKILLVSDNDAYNSLYEFLGQKYLNEQLWKHGYKNVNLIHRLSSPLTKEQNRITNPFTFYNHDEIIYEQHGQKNPKQYKNELPNLLRGIGYIQDDSLISKPKDFTYSNYIALEDLQNVLRAVIFPKFIPARQRLNLTQDDYKFLQKYLSMLPKESKYPKYDTTKYWDSSVKYFMYGDTKSSIPENIRIFNKIGGAYGYLIDNAYIVDFVNKVEFLLTAVIYVNNDRIFNDDKYEYDEIGVPFLANLGKIIYQHELKRNRKFKPNLYDFVIDYSTP
ncbi:MAG: hypothetical protein C4539_03875 [Ignavibacteriales bacterium]|nr:MAG: hypothetical protein C4539_03875 [Ignavibacteriales bacterium]